jgi:hypothetical protein
MSFGMFLIMHFFTFVFQRRQLFVDRQLFLSFSAASLNVRLVSIQ